MSPRVTRALRWALPAALAVLTFPTMAAADPISAAIITTLGFTATKFAVAATTTFLINAAGLAATSCAPTRLFGRTPEPGE